MARPYKEWDSETKTMIKKMCKVCKVDINTIDFTKEGWWTSHEATPKQEKEYKKWLTSYFVKTRKLPVGLAKKTADWYMLYFFFKTKY